MGQSVWLGDSEANISSYHISPQASHCSWSFTEILVVTEPQTVTEKGAFAICPSTTVKSTEITGRYYQKVAPGVKNPPANTGEVRDAGLIPRSERSSGGGHGNHSIILAWRIPWTEEPGGLQSIGSCRVEHDWATKHSTVQRYQKWKGKSMIHRYDQL